MIAALIALLAVVNNPANSVTYACDGTTAAYTVNFPYLSSGDLVVTSTTGPGVVTTLAPGTDWTTNLSSTSSTASLTLNSPATKCPVGNTLKIVRMLAVTQPTSFRAQTTYAPSVHEQAYDRAAMIAQQQATSIVTNASGIATANSNLVTETANRISADTATNNLLAADLAAMAAGGAPGVVASNSTVTPTGATSASALKDLFSRGYSLADFLPVGYVTDCSVDYSAQINTAITATQNSLVTRTLTIPRGCFKTTANHTTAGINVIGEGGAAFNNGVAGANSSEIDCYAAGACLTFNSGIDAGRRLEGIRFVSKAAGQSGLIIESSLGTIKNIALRDFDTAGLQMGIASVVGAYYSDVSNVVVFNPTTQGAIGVLVSGGFPSTNANRFRNVVVSGKLTHMWEINGTKNIVLGGDSDPDTRGTGVAAVWYISGALNEVRGSYSELTVGSAQPTAVVVYTSTTNSNTVSDLQIQYAPQNMSIAFSDAGWNNRLDVRAAGFNLLTVGHNRSDQNLAVNSGFQQWDTVAGAPYGWANIGATGAAAQDTATTHGTATSLKLTGAAQNVIWGTFFVSPTAGDKSLNQYLIGYFRGKQVTCRVWCKSSFAGQGNLRVTTDGTGGASYGQTLHSGSGNWEELTASALIPSDATKVGLHLRNTNGGGTLTGDIWFSEPECVVGTILPHYAAKPLTDTTAQLMGPIIQAPPAALTYGVTVATDASANNSFLITVTNGVAFTISNPTNLKNGQLVLYTLANTSGGVMGAVTLGATFKAPTLVLPATGTNRSYQFQYNGTNLRFLWQSAADVPN